MDGPATGAFFIYALASLICIGGLLISCLSLSGTWAILLATGLLAWVRWPEFPGIGTGVAFLLLCITVEILEALAGAWGVQKRGGSKAAGWAALGGGLLGMILGSFIPIPLLGTLLGMLVGSFTCAFLVEHSKMKEANHAAHVAFGAVLARIGIIFLKIGVTLAMIATLLIGILIG